MNSVAPNLTGDALLNSLKSLFSEVKDHRSPERVKIKLSDILMAGFSVFALKFPSLLQFEEEMRERKLSSRLKPIYKIDDVPSDTQLRTVLDDVEPSNFKKCFSHLFAKIQRGNYLKQFQFYQGKYLLPIDGTQYYTSERIKCDSCMSKKTSDEDNLRYYHQMLGGCIVHPSMKTVIPLCPEPIRRQDGHDKNDSERGALKRFLVQLRSDHPKLPLILTADALHTNGPTIRELLAADIDYILAVKPGSHEKLFQAVKQWDDSQSMSYFTANEEMGDKIKKSRLHQFRFMNRVLLNHADVNLSTNFFEYWETTQWVNPKGELTETKRHFSWVTNFEITNDNIMTLMQGGRARWKIENETFNTLKNQGYELEHNFGHGNNHLSTNFAYLMFLAFLYDQIQQIGCKKFQTVLRVCKGRITYVWNRIREIFKSSYFYDRIFDSWDELLGLAAKSERESTG